MTRHSRRPLGGQALIESAVTIPVLILLFIGFLAIGLIAQAYVDLNTTVYLAAVSAVTAPAGNSALGQQYADETFAGSMQHVPELTSAGITCGGSWSPPATITCQAHAELQLRGTPFSMVVPGNPQISAQATAHGSPYRSA